MKSTFIKIMLVLAVVLGGIGLFASNAAADTPTGQLMSHSCTSNPTSTAGYRVVVCNDIRVTGHVGYYTVKNWTKVYCLHSNTVITCAGKSITGSLWVGSGSTIKELSRHHDTCGVFGGPACAHNRYDYDGSIKSYNVKNKDCVDAGGQALGVRVRIGNHDYTRHIQQGPINFICRVT